MEGEGVAAGRRTPLLIDDLDLDALLRQGQRRQQADRTGAGDEDLRPLFGNLQDIRALERLGCDLHDGPRPYYDPAPAIRRHPAGRSGGSMGPNEEGVRA